MKKLLAALVCLSLLCICMGAIGEESDFTIEDGVLIKYNGSGGEVTIPDGVTELGESAFEDSAITKVNLPETLRAIRSYCFLGCSRLTDITLPASVEEIEYYIDEDGDRVGQAQVFGRNSSLTAINVATGNTHYKSIDGVLYSADKKRLVYFPAGKNAGSEYIVPEGTEEIKYTSFDGANITSITLPASLITLDNNVFAGMSSLTEIKVESGNTEFSSYQGALYQGSNLEFYPNGRTKIKTAKDDFMPGVTRFNEFAFQFDKHIVEIDIPDTVTFIGWRCFETDVLEKVTVPLSVTEIQECGFIYCKNLTSLTILNPNIILNDDAISDCPNVTIYGYDNSTAETYAKEYNLAFSSIGEYAAPTTKPTAEPTLEPTAEPTQEPTSEPTAEPVVTSSPEPTTTETSVTNEQTETPDSTFTPEPSAEPTVTPELEIPSGAIQDSIGTYEVSVASDGTSTAVYTKPAKSTKTVKVPDTVTVTASDGTAVNVPVTSIAAGAFKGDKKLTTITIGANVTTVGKNAFASCSKLKTIKGGENVTSIGANAFKGDKVLTTITLKNVTTIGASAFSGCVKLKTVTLGDNLTTIGAEAFKGCTALTKITIPAKVKSIGKQAFMNCSKLKTITIKSTKLKSGNVGSNAFKGISAKAKITCPKKQLASYKKFLFKKSVPETATIK